MQLLDQSILGIMILLLLAMLVIIKQKTTGAILDKPKGNLLVWLVNSFNLFFLLVVNPLAAILLILRRLTLIDPTHLTIAAPWLLLTLESIGLFLYIIGFFLDGLGLDQIGSVLPVRRNYPACHRCTHHGWALYTG